ncbi:hypothetical protein ACJW30_11G177100 [Castanea mollissima]
MMDCIAWIVSGFEKLTWLSLEVVEGVFEVRSSLADTHLGGDDFDKVGTREMK